MNTTPGYFLSMFLSTLKNKVRAWFTNQVRVDVWSLDVPSTLATNINGTLYPSNTAVEVPLRDVVINDNYVSSNRTISMALPYSVTYRFTGELTEDFLPLDELSALYTNVVVNWLTTATRLDEDILNVGLTNIGAGISETPIVVTRVEDVSKDWLVILMFDFSVEAVLTPETISAIQPPTYGIDDRPTIEVNSLSMGVWRSKLEQLQGSGSTLDSTIEFNKQP